MKVTASMMPILLAATMTLHAERFFLIDESGEQHGPYELRHEGTLTIDGQAYRIRMPRIEHREHEIFERMRQRRIPEVDFRQADLRDVVDFLHRASVEDGPDDGRPRRGIGVILQLEDDRPTIEDESRRRDTDRHADPFAAAPFASDPFGAPTHVRQSPATLITFRALDISLLEAFEIVCELAGLEMKIRGGKLMLIPAQRPAESPEPDRAAAEP